MSAAATMEAKAGGCAMPEQKYVLQVFWEEPVGYAEVHSVRAIVPAGGEFGTYYVELPAAAGGKLRVDPGAEPGVWDVVEIAIYDVDDEGAMIEPAAGVWNEGNGYAGLAAGEGTWLDRVTGPADSRMLRVICWGNDPHLSVQVPVCGARGRVLAARCRVQTPLDVLTTGQAEALLQKLGEAVSARARVESQLRQQEFKVAELEQRKAAQEETIAALTADRDEHRARTERAEQAVEAVQKSHVVRFTRWLSGLYHGMFGR